MGCCDSSENGAPGAKQDTEAARRGYGSGDELGSRSVSSVEDELIGSPFGNTRTGYNDGPTEPIDDPTIDGVINWIRLAEFSSMLPSHVKKKLWNGVFRTETDYNKNETEQIKMIMKVFVSLHLTRV